MFIPNMALKGLYTVCLTEISAKTKYQILFFPSECDACLQKVGTGGMFTTVLYHLFFLTALCKCLETKTKTFPILAWHRTPAAQQSLSYFVNAYCNGIDHTVFTDRLILHHPYFWKSLLDAHFL